MPQRVVALSIVERLAVASQRGCTAAPGSPEQLTFFRVIKALLEHLTLGDVGLSTAQLRAVGAGQVKYLHICETEFFSMGVFVLGKGARIPLHDHPGMTVLSKILTGDVRVRSFDWADAAAATDGAPDLPARMHADVIVHGPSAPRALYAHEGNLHTFQALSTTAMIDIQGPPYNDTDRECRYYRVVAARPPPVPPRLDDQEVPETVGIALAATKSAKAISNDRLLQERLIESGRSGSASSEAGETDLTDASSGNEGGSDLLVGPTAGPRPRSSSSDGVYLRRRMQLDGIVHLRRDDVAFQVLAMETEGRLINPSLFDVFQPSLRLTPDLFLLNNPQKMPDEGMSDLRL